MQITEQTDIKSAAFFYLQLQLPIIPLCPHDHSGTGQGHRDRCNAPGKAPVLSKWQQRSTPQQEEIEEWFNRNPNYNLGLILGDTGHYNLVGIDVDGNIGEELLQSISQGILPPTWEFKTPNGRRLLYELPMGAESKKVVEKGKDGELALLATGQQTVLPPSIHHTKERYEWTSSPEDTDLGEAPTWLLNLLLVQDSEDDSEGTTTTVTPEDWTTKVPEGQRNNQLTKLAGSLIARRNIPKEQIIAFLKQWTQDNCDPPLPENEIVVMVENLHEVELSKQSSRKNKQNKEKPVLQPTAFAESFIQQQRNKGIEWRYCVERGLFYSCDIHVGPWKGTDLIYLNREIRQALIEQEPSWDSKRHVNEVIDALREVLADPVNDDIFDIGRRPDLNHVYVQNGILDWTQPTPELRPWNHETYCTIQLPVVWDPDAKNNELYEYWQNILAEWLPDEDTRLFLQEFIGYCLIPDCSYRTAVFLYGGGSNGKSLFLDVISKLFQGYIEFTPLHWVGERFEASKLLDKLINVCGDIDAKYMSETSTLKSMIAGDPIRAEFKFGKSFHFTPVSRLMFSANQLPKSSDKSEGWYSRWKFVEFPKRFPTDPQFKRQLLDKMGSGPGLSALLYWAVEGLQRLHANQRFTEGKQMTDSERMYRMENDTVQAFADYAIHVTHHAGDSTTLTIPSTYAVYKVWCEDVGVKAVSQAEFTRRMRNLDIHKSVRNVRGISTNVFLGTIMTEEAISAGYEDEYLFNESMRCSAKNRSTRKKREQQ